MILDHVENEDLEMEIIEWIMTLNDWSFSHWSKVLHFERTSTLCPEDLFFSNLIQQKTNHPHPHRASHMKECHGFLHISPIKNHPWFIHQGRQCSSDSGGRKAFGPRTLCRSWESGLAPWREDQRLNGQRFLGEFPRAVPIPDGQIEEIKWYVKHFNSEKSMVEMEIIRMFFSATCWMIGGMWHDSFLFLIFQ